jgi:hypothetical protein
MSRVNEIARYFKLCAEASLAPAPADEEDWRKEEREKGLAVRLYL